MEVVMKVKLALRCDLLMLVQPANVPVSLSLLGSLESEAQVTVSVAVLSVSPDNVCV